jgi:SMI1-KNR4 cell-wall
MKIDKSTLILPLPSDELFERKEKNWRLKLPEDFKSFLKENNGGKPVIDTFSCKENGHEYAIDRFLCILENPKNNENDLGVYDIDVTLTQLEDRLTDNEDLIGAEILPIAVLFAGDFVCLDFREDNTHPCVCVWSHEESGELEPVTYMTASSFGEFISLLS